jgi:hypothetical protein
LHDLSDLVAVLKTGDLELEVPLDWRIALLEMAVSLKHHRLQLFLLELMQDIVEAIVDLLLAVGLIGFLLVLLLLVLHEKSLEKKVAGVLRMLRLLDRLDGLGTLVHFLIDTIRA